MLASNSSGLLTSDLLDMLSAVFGDMEKQIGNESLSSSVCNEEQLGSLMTEPVPVHRDRPHPSPIRSIFGEGALSNNDEEQALLTHSTGIQLRRHSQYRSSDHYSKFSSHVPSGQTTLMMKNIPNKLTREELLGSIKSSMPRGSFNFLYMPIDFKSRCNFGYAFINLVSDVYVEQFTSSFSKRRLPGAIDYCSRAVEVVVARVQGFNANINRLISSPVLFAADEGSLPLIFGADHVSVPFRQLMDLNRASILYHTKPSIEDLIAQLTPYL